MNSTKILFGFGSEFKVLAKKTDLNFFSLVQAITEFLLKGLLGCRAQVGNLENSEFNQLIINNQVVI